MIAFDLERRNDPGTLVDTELSVLGFEQVELRERIASGKHVQVRDWQERLAAFVRCGYGCVALRRANTSARLNRTRDVHGNLSDSRATRDKSSSSPTSMAASWAAAKAWSAPVSRPSRDKARARASRQRTDLPPEVFMTTVPAPYSSAATRH